MKETSPSLLGRITTKAKNVTKKLGSPLLRYTHVLDYIQPDRDSAEDNGIAEMKVLVPKGRVQFADPATDAFVPISKYYRDGSFDRPDIYVCNVTDAYFHVGSGLVCTRNFKAIPDLPYRMPYYSVYGKRRPKNIVSRSGTFTTVYSCHAWNHYSWYVDCLPRMHSLALAAPIEPVTLIMPDTLPDVHRESLLCMMPPNFALEYHPTDTWFKCEHFLWPSLITGRCNGFLPPDYYEAVRRPTFAHCGLPQENTSRGAMPAAVMSPMRNSFCLCSRNMASRRSSSKT